MKKIIVLALVLLLALATFGTALAKGGAPGKHGLTGQEFGAAVSGLAQEDPGALADHVSGMAEGIPAAHELSGSEFGAAVSGLAQTDPVALADHVSGQ